MVERSFRPSEITRIAGISRARLHRYRKSGLIEPTECTAAGYWRYTPADVRRARMVDALVRGGLRGRRLRSVLEEVSLEVEVIVGLELSTR